MSVVPVTVKAAVTVLLFWSVGIFVDFACEPPDTGRVEVSSAGIVVVLDPCECDAVPAEVDGTTVAASPESPLDEAVCSLSHERSLPGSDL